MGPVIVLTYTVMDGPCLRWYHSIEAARSGGDYMSASRNGVHVCAFLDRIPETEIVKARQAAAAFASGHEAAVAHFATHQKHFPGRELEPITHVGGAP